MNKQSSLNFRRAILLEIGVTKKKIIDGILNLDISMLKKTFTSEAPLWYFSA